MSSLPALALVLALGCDSGSGPPASARGAGPAPADSVAPPTSPAGAGAVSDRENSAAAPETTAAGHAALAASPATVPCPTMSHVAPLPQALAESSGLAASRRHPGILWSIDDSGNTPDVFAIDTTGRLVGRVRLSGARNRDWEDIALGPCPGGECLYVSDTGDNLASRSSMIIYRVREPEPTARTTAPADALPVAYPDRARDTEAIFVTDEGAIFLVSKGRSDPVSVWRYPGRPRPGQLRTLRPVQQLTSGKVELPDMVTAASARGGVVAIRTYTGLRFYRPGEGGVLAPLADSATSLSSIAESQGEGVALGDDGEVWLTSEAGPGGSRGQLSRAECRLPGR